MVIKNDLIVLNSQIIVWFQEYFVSLFFKIESRYIHSGEWSPVIAWCDLWFVDIALAKFVIVKILLRITKFSIVKFWLHRRSILIVSGILICLQFFIWHLDSKLHLLGTIYRLWRFNYWAYEIIFLLGYLGLWILISQLGCFIDISFTQASNPLINIFF